jgi:hypothetical protein
MITNDGKEVISKYLIGQVPTFATHLAIGCGADPLGVADAIPNSVYGQQRLDFEMVRVPISSKGFVDDSQTFVITNKALTSNVATLTTSAAHNIVVGETVIVSGVDATFNGQYRVTATNAPTNTTFSYSEIAANVTSAAVSPNGSAIVSRTKISITAELPTASRYDITEVGLLSTGSNNLAGQYDSRMLFNFAQSWEQHGTSITTPPTVDVGAGAAIDIAPTTKAFYVATNNSLFQNTVRKDRNEGPRHLNTSLLVRGDLSTITGAINADWTATGDHIHLNGINFDISGNNTADIMKLAFSMIDETAVAGTAADNVKIYMEFFKSELDTTSGFAKAQIYVPGTTLNANRYFVANFTPSQTIDYSNQAASTSLPYVRFYTAPDFSPSTIRVCRIFVAITKAAAPDPDHYIAFDGFRIDNTTENPVHKLTGYSIIKKNGRPITKLANTNNYVDFRFSLGVS